MTANWYVIMHKDNQQWWQWLRSDHSSRWVVFSLLSQEPSLDAIGCKLHCSLEEVKSVDYISSVNSWTVRSCFFWSYAGSILLSEEFRCFSESYRSELNKPNPTQIPFGTVIIRAQSRIEIIKKKSTSVFFWDVKLLKC